MSQFSGGHRETSRTPTPTSSPPAEQTGFHPRNTAAQNPDRRSDPANAPGNHTNDSFASGQSPLSDAQPHTSTSVPRSTAGDFASPNHHGQAIQDTNAIPDEYASSPAQLNRSRSPSASPSGRHRRSSSRPVSMVQTYQPPVMDVSDDTIPELQPIFTLLNSHANKLYQEGYFLKLDDQNTRELFPLS
jgi:CCR4-NOT transcriptional complex subunit CAF120